MKKHFYSFLTVAMTLWALIIPTMSATAADDNTLAISDFTASAGSTVDLSVSMNNKAEITSFEFDLELPEGVSVYYEMVGADKEYAIDLSTSRTTLKNHTLSYDYVNGYMHVLCFSSKNAVFSGNTGEVLTIKLAVANTMKDGKYSVGIKNMELTENMTTYHPADVTAILTVGEETPVYEEGYALYVKPFAAVKSNSLQVYLDAPKDIASVQFDAEFPANFTPATIKMIGSRLSDEDFADFAATSKSGATQKFETEDAEIVCLSSGSGAAFTWAIAKKDAVVDGIYQLSLSNISVVDVEGETHQIAPYKTSIFVGDLSSISEVPALYGDFTGEGVKAFNAVFAENVVATSFDFTNATAFDSETVLAPGNKNALFLAPEGAVPANENNVVVNDVCANLVLTDGKPFGPAKTFTVKAGEYSRTLSADTYGTIVLPFTPDAETLKGYTFYELTDVETNALTFDEVSNPVAGKPYIVTSDGTATKMSAEAESAVVIEPAATEVDGWTMTGTYESVVFTDADELANLYCISGNQFKQATSKLTMNPFRAYFVGDGSAKSIELRGDDGSTRIIDLTEDAQNGMLYDVLGRKVEMPAQGIYIHNGKKALVK